jgi:hypothetical protein
MKYLLMRPDESYVQITRWFAYRLMRDGRVHEAFYTQTAAGPRCFIVTHVVYNRIAGSAGPVA